MPTSSYTMIPEVLNIVIQIHPKSILDIGIGFGKYGFLFREYLDIAQGRIQKSDWSKRIDGVEVFEPYISDIQKSVYDNVYIGNILDLKDQLPFYQLIYMGDVLEHIEKEKAVELLNTLLEKCEHLLLAIPVGRWDQAEINGNQYEKHLVTWNKDDINKIPHIVGGRSVMSDGKQIILVHCKPELPLLKCSGS
jgi:2-polyprenyl-3-methyl-5-hydroxy-6-metoxy-1,4-benzoquinol methylase